MTNNKPYEAIKKEREAAKQAKEHIKRQRERTKKMKPYLVLGVLLVLLIGFGYFITKQTGPEGSDMSVAIPEQGREHIAVGTEHEPYNSNPPTSGPHYAEPAAPGFRGDDDIADEHIVHSLEHGLIWISYTPDVTEAVINALREFDDGLTVITARTANDTDIAVAAWGRLDTFDVGEALTDAELQRIQDFITRYANRGPERIPPGQHGGV